jgi:hypothetical protein
VPRLRKGLVAGFLSRNGFLPYACGSDRNRPPKDRGIRLHGKTERSVRRCFRAVGLLPKE